MRAALARAAGLSMVAYDNNGLENQFLQGWLIQDRFLMMTSFGAPYEFLWANPYQPGLSYYQLPLVFHDPNSGALFVRSGWDEDADWFGLYAGEAELFHDGHVTVVNQGASGSSAPKPLQLGDASVILGRAPFQFSNGRRRHAAGDRAEAAPEISGGDRRRRDAGDFNRPRPGLSFFNIPPAAWPAFGSTKTAAR